MPNKKTLITALASGAAPDTTAPTCVITCDQASPTPVSPITYTYTWSEDVTGFTVGDAGIVGGTKGTFTAVSAKVYTLSVVPNALATVTASVAANVCIDAAGNNNTAASDLVIVSSVAFDDEFTTAASAPLTSPRTAEPGPGTLTITDTGNKLSIISGAVNFPSSTVNNSDPRAFAPVRARATGLTAFYSFDQVAASNWQVGWRVDATATPNSFGIKNSTNLFLVTGYTANIALPEAVANATQYQAAFINNGFGGLLLMKGGAYPDWTLAHVFRDAGYVTNGANVYAGFGCGTSANFNVHCLRTFVMGAPFATDTGLATSVSASPSAGDTATQAANAIVEMTWTAVTGQTWNLYVRRGADDTHTWAIRCDQGGSTIKLIEINGGETERSSAAQTFTNGTSYRITAIMDGNNIWVYVANALKNTYTSASFQNTATGVKTDRAGTNLIAWPRAIASSALTELSRFVANP